MAAERCRADPRIAGKESRSGDRRRRGGLGLHHRDRLDRRSAGIAAPRQGRHHTFWNRGIMQADQLILTISLAAIPVLFAITLHEAAHGYVARHFGDMTAHAQGRISLNPIRHIDLVGTIIVPAIIVIASRLAMGSVFLFGWAKPVPVNYSALRKPRQHMAWVAAAGPAA